jgi:hypothetical protein
MQDIIGECAFGYSIDSQKKPSPYSQAIFDCSELVTKRIFNPIFKFDFIYHNTANGRRWLEALKIVHELPEIVIKDRYEKRMAGEQREACGDTLSLSLKCMSEAMPS